MTNLNNNSVQNKSVGENLPPENNQETESVSKECQRWNGCSAPICPIYGGDQWFKDEEICKKSEFSDLNWIKRQRKIARTAIDTDTLYTKTMLERDCVVTKQIQGLDPDREYSCREADEEGWLRKHPGKKAKSKDQIERSRNALAKYRQGLTPRKNDESAKENKKKDANPSSVSDPKPPE